MNVKLSMKNPGRRLVSSFIVIAVLALTSAVRGEETGNASTRLVAGSTLERITVGRTTYTQVRVRTVSAQTAMIQHSTGIASLRLRDLSSELQQQFGYDPEAAVSEAEKQKAAALEADRRRQEMQRAQQTKARVVATNVSQDDASADTKLDELFRSFGTPPDVQAKVDLRTRMSQLGLWVKNQGGVPSCSIFAIVGALEYQTAELTGTAERFSDDYLLWATRKTLNRAPPAVRVSTDVNADETTQEEGYALTDVVAALRSYGIPTRQRVGSSYSASQTPSSEIIAEARASRRVSVHVLPGRDEAGVIENIIHALNAGIPVPIGIAWPVDYNWRTGYLDKQTVHKEGGHAVTLVGYTSKTGRLEDTVFSFKNSYGPRWGIDGYGHATYEFLSKNLQAAVVLEVQPK
jgi:C1A family cysteine protease